MKLSDEFDRRYGRVKPRFFHTSEVGTLTRNLHTVSVMQFFWKKPPQFVELVAPFTVNLMDPQFSESYSDVLYIDSRQLKDLRAIELKVQQLEIEKDRQREEELGKATKHF